ncbi:dihydrodipicolinate synthase family protein [Thalassoglobus polymorphus]|uniref:4-hydroxy-tetrahydrodipicolinate synthase n=1 Tax=Thalassoglobus polymorphus TaxID=2527994 RepID=A0A517QKC5_9PLAN|nr:dihydrodipicolinate synthase family protein [Thalassoglobus polymorphus]QDT32090.1 4-hydroxy-tetrahydrodipicolinate synthase [Thalassoglobus polymorphus]
MKNEDLVSRRTLLKSTLLGASSVAAGTLSQTSISAASPETIAKQVPVKLRSPDYPRFRGPFPILSTPFTNSGEVDFEVLAREARFADWCESPGMIWPQSNDSVDLLTQNEKLEGMEVLAKTSRNLKTTALCLGVQGEDTDDMLVYAKHARKLSPTAVISRPPDTGKTQEDLRQYWRALASVITEQPVMIQTTARRGGVSPSTELLIELAEEFPNFGYVKEESNPVIPRVRKLLESPSIRSVFSARGAYGWLYESRLGTEGLVTERLAYADILAKIWKLMRSGDDPAMLKDMYSKLTLMFNLSQTHPGNLRGYSLYLLKMRGVFNTMISRQYGPNGTTPAQPIIRDLTLSNEEIAEIEWRFESLKPFLKPGKFTG